MTTNSVQDSKTLEKSIRSIGNRSTFYQIRQLLSILEELHRACYIGERGRTIKELIQRIGPVFSDAKITSDLYSAILSRKLLANLASPHSSDEEKRLWNEEYAYMGGKLDILMVFVLFIDSLFDTYTPGLQPEMTFSLKGKELRSAVIDYVDELKEILESLDLPECYLGNQPEYEENEENLNEDLLAIKSRLLEMKVSDILPSTH